MNMEFRVHVVWLETGPHEEGQLGGMTFLGVLSPGTTFSDSHSPTFQLAATHSPGSTSRTFTTQLVRRIVELMAPTTLELDGLTSFRSHPRSSFRFILTLTGNKLNVWLENRKSKKQW